MSEETITFEMIRKVQREEQKVPKLTKLPDNFFNAVASYLEQKKKMVKNDDRKDFLEVKSIERLVEDIVNRRERKIINVAIIYARTSIPPENLLEEEKSFYNSLVDLIKSRRQDILKTIVVNNDEQIGSKFVFKEAVPEFVGSDLKTYGPFSKGDTAELPEDNAKLLLVKGAIEEFKS